MPKNRFNTNSPTTFANMPPEKFQEICRLSKEAKAEIKKRKVEMQEYLDFLGNSTVDYNGVQVPRNFLILYKLYEKALAGNEKAIKMILDVTIKQDPAMRADIFANIIKLKID